MANNVQNYPEENNSLAKRKKVLSAVAKEIITSEDDDNVADGIDVCNVIESQLDQRVQLATSDALRALGETIRNTLLEINDIREQNRECRHRELLQILTKMEHLENAPKNKNTKTEFNTETSHNEQHTSKNENAASEEDGLLNENIPNTNEVEDDDCTMKTFKNIGNVVEIKSKNHVDSTKIAHNSSVECIKLLHKSELTNKLQQTKIKNGVKHDTKKEFQKMRAQMLELQRQKMEDRERKKREFLRMQNM